MTDAYAYYNVSSSPYNRPKHKVIAIGFDEELPEGYKVDMKKTWSKLIESPVSTILSGYGTTWDYIETGMIEKKLSESFTFSSKKEGVDDVIYIQGMDEVFVAAPVQKEKKRPNMMDSFK